MYSVLSYLGISKPEVVLGYYFPPDGIDPEVGDCPCWYILAVPSAAANVATSTSLIGRQSVVTTVSPASPFTIMRGWGVTWRRCLDDHREFWPASRRWWTAPVRPASRPGHYRSRKAHTGAYISIRTDGQGYTTYWFSGRWPVAARPCLVGGPS